MRGPTLVDATPFRDCLVGLGGTASWYAEQLGISARHVVRIRQGHVATIRPRLAENEAFGHFGEDHCEPRCVVWIKATEDERYREVEQARREIVSRDEEIDQQGDRIAALERELANARIVLVDVRKLSNAAFGGEFPTLSDRTALLATIKVKVESSGLLDNAARSTK